MLRFASHSALTLLLAAPPRPEGPAPAPAVELAREPDALPRERALVLGGLGSLVLAGVGVGLAVAGGVLVGEARRDVADLVRPYDDPPRLPDAQAVARLAVHNRAGEAGERLVVGGAIAAGVFALLGAALLGRVAALRRRGRASAGPARLVAAPLP